MTHGLVVRDSFQSSSDAYRVSRLGRETLKYGVARLAAGERLGVALHPRLAQRIEQQVLLGEFELAVFAAMKEVEVPRPRTRPRIAVTSWSQADAARVLG